MDMYSCEKNVLDLLASPLHVCVKQEHPGGSKGARMRMGKTGALIAWPTLP